MASYGLSFFPSIYGGQQARNKIEKKRKNWVGGVRSKLHAPIPPPPPPITLHKVYAHMIYSSGVGAVARSLPPNAEVPGCISGLIQG